MLFNFLTEEARRLIKAPIPQEIIEDKKGFSYVEGSSYIDVLNKVFDYNWSWQIKEHWVIDAAETNNGKKQQVAHVLGTITVCFYDEKTKTVQEIKKDGFGAQPISGDAAAQHENSFKGAETDAIKRAARNFGIFLDLWRSEPNKLYFAYIQNQEWSEEDYISYKNEMDYLKNIFTNIYTTEEEQSAIVREFSNNKIHNKEGIRYHNILDFCEFLKKKLNSNNKKGVA